MDTPTEPTVRCAWCYGQTDEPVTIQGVTYCSGECFAEEQDSKS